MRDEDYQRLLKPVADELVYPAPLGLDVRDPRNTDGCYIKRANLIGFDDDNVAEILPKIVLEEAKTLQYLKLRHHPNLAKYYGCILKDNPIAGLVLKQYGRTLQQHLQQGHYDSSDFDASFCMSCLRSGIQYLHSLGLSAQRSRSDDHALDEENGFMILDFGSCARIREGLNSGGTPGWFDEDSADYAVSSKSHDECGLHKMECWLHKKRRAGLESQQRSGD